MLERMARAMLPAWIALALAPGAGCTDGYGRSEANLRALAQRLGEYHARHRTPPESLDQLAEFFADEAEFRRALRNPLTGDDPGYQYVKPPAGVLDSSLAHRVVVLYQLRSGQRATDLPVGYAGGDVDRIVEGAITATVPEWRDFAPPGAAVSVRLPVAPVGPDCSVTDPANFNYRASFCGVQYVVLAMQTPMFRVAARGDPQVMMRALRDETAAHCGGRVVASREAPLSGRPGLAAEMDVPGKDSEIRVRWCMDGDRLYCLSVSGPKGSLGEENAGVFFDSVRLLDR